MKPIIAGCMPLKLDPEKTKMKEAMECLESICDYIFVLHDNPSGPHDWYQYPRGTPVRKQVEDIGVINYGPHAWNDYVNRLTLMARAAAYGCKWIVQLDDDETLGPTLTRSQVEEMISYAEELEFREIICKVRTVWDDGKHWRTDGPFGKLDKSLIIENGLLKKSIAFENTPADSLHHFPVQEGKKLQVGDYIYHWGLRTPELRQKNFEKYKVLDPENKMTGMNYDYLLKEEGIVLETLQ